MIQGDFSIHDEEVFKPFLKKIGKGLYLEIGVKYGKSLSIARKYAKKAEIYGIDIRNNDFDYKYFRNKNVNFIHKDSSQVDWDKEINLLFIDGNHDQEQVEKDIEKYWRFVKGYILFHDYDITSPGVIIAVDNFVKNNNLVLENYRYSKPGLATSIVGVKI